LGIYDDEENAAKEANHQLKGLTALYNAHTNLKLPLLTIVKYNGYKLVAMSVLPIRGEKTLVMGSPDGGRHFQELEGKEFMHEAALRLNLCQHSVGNAGHRTSMPCDMEIHKVFLEATGETRFYVVDFARLFPPQAPCIGSLVDDIYPPAPHEYAASREGKSGHLQYMLRPELVRNFHISLSSDSFSRFATSTETCHNENAIIASRFLLQNVISDYSKELQSRDFPSTKIEFDRMEGLIRFESDQSQILVAEMHKRGINMRFLGLIFKLIKGADLWKAQILIEACARCFKSIISKQLRNAVKNVRTVVLSPYISCLTTELNAIFGESSCCECGMKKVHRKNGTRNSEIWCSTLPLMLHKKFFFPINTGTLFRQYLMKLASSRAPHATCDCCVCLWKLCFPHDLLFARLIGFLNVKVNRGIPISFGDPLKENELELNATVEVLPIMEFFRGTEALLRHQYQSAKASRDISFAEERFKIGIEKCSWDHRLLRSVGMIHQAQGQADEALQYFIESIEANELDAASWYHLGKHLMELYKVDKIHVSILDRVHKLVKPSCDLLKTPALICIECILNQACRFVPGDVNMQLYHADFMFYALKKEKRSVEGMIAVYGSMLCRSPGNINIMLSTFELHLYRYKVVKRRLKDDKRAGLKSKLVEILRLMKTCAEKMLEVSKTAVNVVRMATSCLNIFLQQAIQSCCEIKLVADAVMTVSGLNRLTNHELSEDVTLRKSLIELAQKLAVSYGILVTIGSELMDPSDFVGPISDIFEACLFCQNEPIDKGLLFRHHAECLLMLIDSNFKFKNNRDLKTLRAMPQTQSVSSHPASIVEIFKKVEMLMAQHKKNSNNSPLSESLYLSYRVWSYNPKD